MICWLTINRTCNMRCKWCYARDEGFKSDATMPLTTFENILRAIGTLPISRFIILGGEPTLHRDLPAMIRRLKPNKVALVTNALKLTDKGYLSLLKDSGLDVVTISLKGSSEEEYKQNTGVNGLGKVERAVANLNELGITHCISVTFSSSVVKVFPQVLSWMKSTNAQSMSINYCRPVVLDNDISMEGVPNPKEMARQTVKSYEMVRSSGAKCVYNFMLPLCLLPLEFIRELVKENLLTTVCQLQKGNGLIFMPDGTLIPCNHLFGYPLGKAGEDFTTADEFINFRKGEEVKTFYQKTGSLPDKRCQTCSLKAQCGGGCFIQYLHYKPAELVVRPFHGSVT
ncbi:MAG: radical SAM protein [Patescibacteria group bacterium]|nr:radical SAM protein [Patescibacteria group bacterium]